MPSTEVTSVWVSGQLMPSWEADRQASAETIHGGVSEIIRCYATSEGPAVFRLEEHIDHFFDSAKRRGIPIPFTLREMRAAVCQIVSANGLADCFVRPAAFFAGRIETAVAARPWPWTDHAGKALFVVRNGIVSASADASLTTVMRDTILTVARDLGYEVATSDPDASDLAAADEAFSVDAAAHLEPLNAGPVTHSIQKAFAEATAGRNPKYRSWLHFVDDCMLTGAYNAASWI